MTSEPTPGRVLPPSLGALVALERLDLSACTALEALPSSIAQLPCLRSLNLQGCTALTELPDLGGLADCLEELDLSDIQERGQVLGASAGDGFDLGDARTTMATLNAFSSFGQLVLTGRGSIASTRITGAGDLLRFDGPLIGTAFALEGAHPLWGGRFTVGLSSPLRLERARAIVAAPVTYDLMTGALDTEDLLLNLAPDAREIDIELGWSAWLFDRAALRLGVAHAFDAGHVSGASDTAGFITFTIR